MGIRPLCAACGWAGENFLFLWFGWDCEEALGFLGLLTLQCPEAIYDTGTSYVSFKILRRPAENHDCQFKASLS